MCPPPDQGSATMQVECGVKMNLFFLSHRVQCKSGVVRCESAHSHPYTTHNSELGTPKE